MGKRRRCFGCGKPRTEAVCPTCNPSKIKVGSRVAYSVQWLKSIRASKAGRFAGPARCKELCHARGTAKSFKKIGIGDGELTMVKVDWGDGYSCFVNLRNLARVGANVKFCSC